MKRIYDIGKELFSSSVYPGDPVPCKETFLEISENCPCNLTLLTMGSHNGTHLDAPRHFIKDGAGVDEIPLEKCIGPCKVVSARGEITEEQMEAWLFDRTQKLLIKGDILLTPQAARVMARCRLDLVGVESQTVGEGETQTSIHRILLAAQVVILEGLVLDKVQQGSYFLAAQPLKLSGLDGSPVRPVLWEM